MKELLQRMKMNPIMRKEVMVQVRSMKFSWGFFAYETVLALVFVITVLVISLFDNNSYQSMIALFPIIAGCQCGIVALVVPILTAGSIAGEKERQTFDILLTTPLSPMKIIFGKTLTCVAQVMFYVVGSIPIMAISFTYGGLSWGVLVLFLLLTLVYAFYLGAIGIFCSTISRKTIACVILAFVFYIATQFITFMPILMFGIFSEFEYVWETPLLVLFNPFILLTEFFFWAMTGETIIGEMGSFSDRLGYMGPVSAVLFQEPLFIIVSLVAVMGLSLLMMKLAANRIDPLRYKAKKKAGK